jgi:hypothetical protein
MALESITYGYSGCKRIPLLHRVYLKNTFLPPLLRCMVHNMSVVELSSRQVGDRTMTCSLPHDAFLDAQMLLRPMMGRLLGEQLPRCRLAGGCSLGWMEGLL